MFYFLLKAYARVALKLAFVRIKINEPSMLKQQGPVLFAGNHPNSFLDGILLTTFFRGKLYSLARGDAFNGRFINKLLRRLRLLPVYRTSEGIENLEHNYTTFAACHQVFKQNNSVLIFSEGRCENEWHLRPLKKGTARLALQAWQQEMSVAVIPVGINYSSFHSFGKEVHILFGKPLQKNAPMEQNEARQLLQFNEQLEAQLQTLVYEILPADKQRLHAFFPIHKRFWTGLLLLPGLTGAIVHLPLYSIGLLLAARYRHTGHYDSVLTAFLMLAYPVYLAIMYLLLLFYCGWLMALSSLLLPFTAWSAVQLKYRIGYR